MHPCSSLSFSPESTGIPVLPDPVSIRVRHLGRSGGEGGIRTHGTRKGTPVFETGPIDHSGTSPRLLSNTTSRSGGSDDP
jgi:hypothetical protein